MNALIENAHVVLLSAFQATGIKLKLIKSLCMGRHCLVNKTMVNDTFLEGLCHQSDDNWYQKTKSLMSVPFTEVEIKNRNKILHKHYNNLENAKLILKYLDVKN